MRGFNILLALLFSTSAFAQHTFSVVAVDPVSGEVGGAGATCYETVNDIADVHPGVGFIHTQSYVNYTNQQYAKLMMDGGLAPQEIMDSIQVVDADNDSTIRQYAAVDLINGGRSAAFTGSNCFSYHGQRLGATYAIAGNILLGPQILDSMESRFNSTQGSLADKLMAALEGAKVKGADSRCLADSVSSLSAYMIVAKPDDVGADYYVNLNVENVYPADPIDVLVQDYEAWKDQNLNTSIEEEKVSLKVTLFPNPTSGITTLESNIDGTCYVLDSLGKVLHNQSIVSGINSLELGNLSTGVYLCRTDDNKDNFVLDKIIIQ